MKPSAVLFDCDGVIVDSEPITNRLIAQNLARHGLHLPLDRIVTLFVGGTIQGVGETARAMGADLPPDWLDAIYGEIFEALALGTPLVPGVERVLDALDNAAIPIAIGSNGPHEKMAVTLGQHPAVQARFGRHVYSRTDVARPKPAPDLYLHAADQLGVAPKACAVIEDSPSGIRAAIAAGMTAFGYAPDGNGARLAAEGAQVFTAMADLPVLLAI